LRLLYVVLLVSYPIVLHILIAKGRPEIGLAYFAILLSWSALTDLLKRKTPDPLLLLTISAAGIAIMLFRGNEILFLKLVPITIYLSLALVFSSSLRAGSEPLITRMAILVRGEITDREKLYTYRVTVAWAIFFFTMVITSGLLATLATDREWSLFTNIISYLLTGAFFITEFLVRRVKLASEVNYSFKSFITALAKVDFSKVIKGPR